MPVLAFFVLLPLIEIGLFILAGSVIGFWATLGLIVATTILGVMVLRSGRAVAMAQLRRAEQNPAEAAAPLAGLAARQMAGMLLVLPGFFTDAVGLLLLLPPVQKALFGQISRRFTVFNTAGGGFGTGFGGGFGGGNAGGPQWSQPARDQVIDAEAVEIVEDAAILPPDHPSRRGQRPSGWTQSQD